MPYRCSALALWEVFRAITVRHYTKSFWTPSSLILDTPVQNHPVIAEPCLARRHPAVAGLTRELARHKVFLPFTSYHSPVTFSTHFGQSLRTFGWPLKTMLSFIYKIFKQHFGSRNCGTNLRVSRTRKMANTVSPWRTWRKWRQTWERRSSDRLYAFRLWRPIPRLRDPQARRDIGYSVLNSLFWNSFNHKAQRHREILFYIFTFVFYLSFLIW